jgi:hypothetical protein
LGRAQDRQRQWRFAFDDLIDLWPSAHFEILIISRGRATDAHDSSLNMVGIFLPRRGKTNSLVLE